ncbi:AAA family ATPase [Actinoplanes sp. NPDC051633]|uniref:ATP-dependent nuclease n=1 Tax=Actinoplanes sp. NPDC051633 TaxID=3155670 RepID=UPI0034233076
MRGGDAAPQRGRSPAPPEPWSWTVRGPPRQLAGTSGGITGARNTIDCHRNHAGRIMTLRNACCEAFVLKRITLHSFKGFRKFNLTFNPDVSVLVGPNSAGKTTIVGAIRLCAALLDQARRRNPGDATARAAGKPRAHTIADVSIDNAAFNDENIYHNFLREEATIELTFTNGGFLRVEWPESEDPSPRRGFFSLTGPPGNRARGTNLAKTSFPEIGVVPTLTPCEGRERLVTARTARANYTTRLASVRFRNQLWQTYLNEDAGTWDEFVEFLLQNTPEISGIRLERSDAGRDEFLDLFCRESRSGKEREITWLGDGLQTWLQVLFHLWRERDRPCLILDEPDVFMHPDLQRRLITLVRGADTQVILATHSVEILNEVGPDSAIAINLELDGGTRFSGGGAIAEFAGQIGSGLQFGLARALTRKAVLFVEGQDAALLRILAQRVGAVKVANEQGLSTVSIGGFSGWSSVAGFTRILQKAGGGPAATVLLDRDYRSDEVIADIAAQVRRDGANVHVWHRKEIENYLLSEEVIARVSGVAVQSIHALMDRVADGLRNETLAAWIGRRQRDAPKKLDLTSVARTAIVDFESAWDTEKLELVPGKRFISTLNQEVAAIGGQTFNSYRLAREIRSSELDGEVLSFIRSLEIALA